MKIRFLSPLFLFLGSCFLGTMASGATGDLLGSFNFGAGDLVADPIRPYIYATIPSTNSIAVFNTTTLSLQANIFIGSNPSGLALSVDNTKLYVANSGSTANAIGILDLATLTTLTSISAPKNPIDVAVGNGGRLYASGSEGIMQFDTVTGTYVKSFPGYSEYLSYGRLEMSPDRNTLYEGNVVYSPAHLQRYDVSSANGTLLQDRSFSQGGTVNAVASHNGQFVLFLSGYGIEKLAAGNLNSSYGIFNAGAYPGAAAFSPDDNLVYAARYGGTPLVEIFNANTFVQTGSFSLADTANSLLVDNSGRYLFVAEGSKVQIFSTGVPEPGLPLFAVGVGMVMGLTRRVRGISRKVGTMA